MSIIVITEHFDPTTDTSRSLTDQDFDIIKDCCPYFGTPIRSSDDGSISLSLLRDSDEDAYVARLRSKGYIVHKVI
jgi:hypothetical protein